MKKKYYLVVDTETANIIEQPLVFDIGFVVTDRHGHIYEKFSYVINEIFWGEEYDYHNPTLMAESYYAEKLPTYRIHLKLRDGLWECASFWTIKSKVKEIINKYGITEVYAYNSAFDLTALNTTCRYISKGSSRYFFPYGIEVNCIWHMACQTILSQKTFLKEAYENVWYKSSGNVLTNAETCYKYITGMINYEEKHTALEDALIEAEILAYCFRQHKKMDKAINRSCWRIPQKSFKEICEKMESANL